MGLVPLPEWGGIDLDDSVLDEGVRTNKFVVGRVVDLDPPKVNRWYFFAWLLTYNRDDSGLAGGVLRSPCEVAGLKAKGTVLHVSTTGADRVNAFSTKLGAGGLATELEFSLLAVVGTLSTGLRALVAG